MDFLEGPSNNLSFHGPPRCLFLRFRVQWPLPMPTVASDLLYARLEVQKRGPY